MSAADAVSQIKSGSRIYLGGGAACPSADARHDRPLRGLRNVEVVHILTFADAPTPRRDARLFPPCALFIGHNVRKAVNESRADFTPVFLSEIPDLSGPTAPCPWMQPWCRSPRPTNTAFAASASR